LWAEVYSQLKQAALGISSIFIAGIAGIIGLRIKRYFANRIKSESSNLVSTQQKEIEMTVQKVTVTMEVPKELKEIIDAESGILRDIKAKKPIAEIVAGNLQKLIAAVEGFDKVDEEIKSDGKDEAAGYLVQQNMDALGI
jgi:hypothetical protein